MRLCLILAIVFCCGCATKGLLVRNASGNFVSAKQLVEKDTELFTAGIKSESIKNEIAVVKVRIFNKSGSSVTIAPDNFMLLDNSRNVLPMVSPEDSVGIVYGEVNPTQVAYMANNPTSYTYTGNTAVYGNQATTYGTITPSNSFGSGFNSGFNSVASGYAAGVAGRNAKILKEKRKAKTDAFAFGEIPSNAAKEGSLYFYIKKAVYPLAFTVDVNGSKTDFEITDKLKP